MTRSWVCRTSKVKFATHFCIRYPYKFIRERLFLLVAILFMSHWCHDVSAQESGIKDGAALYSIGFGYEWMSDAYSSKGFALDVRARFYMSEQLFGELMGHWGTHDGGKSVMQRVFLSVSTMNGTCCWELSDPAMRYFRARTNCLTYMSRDL